MIPPKLLEQFRESRDSILMELDGLVRSESPSGDKEALDVLATLLANRLGQLGGTVEIFPNQQGADHLFARFPGAAGRRPALVLGHYDTVWPIGTLKRLPFRVEGNRAFGPGIYDMKAGLAIVLCVLAKVIPATPMPRPIWVLITSDEEIGSPTSRRLIEEVAARCAYVLVLEPPLADGSLKTAQRESAGSGSKLRARRPMPAWPPRTAAARSWSSHTRSCESRICKTRPPGRR